MKHPASTITLALAAVLWLGLGLSYLMRAPETPDPRPVYQAAQAFKLALVAKGQPVPPTVSLADLTREGFYSQSQAAAFDGYEVRVSFTADDRRPQDVLMQVRFPDGGELVVLCDGSVQSRP
jgi:hypothetical protein